MRVLVCGSRTWTDGRRIQSVLVIFWNQCPTVVHGAARGADSLAADVAEGLGFPTEAYPADWKTHGKRAGYLRNAEMLASGIDRVFAFRSDGESKGTDQMIALARAAGVPVTVVEATP